MWRIGTYSALMPAPPSRSRQSRATSRAMRQLFHFASETWDGLHRALLLQAAELQREQLRGGDAAGHVGQADLDGLVLGERAAEQDAGLGVVEQLARQACAAPMTPQAMP